MNIIIALGSIALTGVLYMAACEVDKRQQAELARQRAEELRRIEARRHKVFQTWLKIIEEGAEPDGRAD